MASRLKLHEEFCNILGTRNVYYNPPESVKLAYPCIKYSRSAPDIRHANDRIYKNTNKYEVFLIDRDPDSVYRDEILTHFQMCKIDREYNADGLKHVVYTLYY